MCYSQIIGRKTSIPRPKIAKQDIKVWKSVKKIPVPKKKGGTFYKNRFESVHLYFIYQRGYIYYETERFHPRRRILPSHDIFEISKGLHSFSYIPKFLLTNECIIELTIPKEAKYYFNGTTYISNKLVF